MNEITSSEVQSAREYLEYNPGHGRYRLADYMKINSGRAGRIIDKLKNGGVVLSTPEVQNLDSKEKSTIKQTFDDRTWRISADQVRIKSVEELIKQFEIDTRIWRVKKFECVSHEMAMAPRAVRREDDKWTREDNRALVVPLYNVRAEFERVPENEAAIKIVDSLKKDIEKLALPKVYPCEGLAHLFKQNGYCLEVSIPDVHFGKLAWAPETGWENYDLSIAKRIWKAALDDLLSRSYGNIEKIWFVVGNDMIHFDSKNWATTRGTLQDGDSRYHKVFSQVQTLMIQSVEDMLRLAPVDIKTVPGNHDEHAAWHLGNSLKMAFRGFKYVDVDDSPNPRKYAQFGQNMLLWDHGHEIKTYNYPSLMAKEQPEMFCSSRYHEVHTGHFHTKRETNNAVDEAMGVRIRILPSLSASDSWHAGKGYVGNVRSAESYLWDKDGGMIQMSQWNVPSNFE